MKGRDAFLINNSLRRKVQCILSTLMQREANVITLYLELNGEHSMTLEDDGDKSNLTREWVRQTKAYCEKKVCLSKAKPGLGFSKHTVFRQSAFSSFS